MSDSDELLAHARRAFRQAAETSDLAAMQAFVEIGQAYLRMAHEDAAIFDASDDGTEIVRLVR
jgi:hypothetical protein